MPEIVPQQNIQLGDFARVDTNNAENLVARLDEMHALESFRDYKRKAYELLKLIPGASVADVGCGTGDDAKKLTEFVYPAGRVVGFDHSEAMLAEARQRHSEIEGLSFAIGSSEDLGVAEGSFDAVRADRLLIHVPDPRKTLAEMVRVAKPGGRIVVSEPDMPGCWLRSNHPDIAARVMTEVSNSCVSPSLPRELWALFKDIGLTDVTFTVSPVIAFDPMAVGRMLNVQGAVDGMISKGLLSTSEANDWLTGLAEQGASGRFVASLCIITVAGTKR